MYISRWPRAREARSSRLRRGAPRVRAARAHAARRRALHLPGVVQLPRRARRAAAAIAIALLVMLLLLLPLPLRHAITLARLLRALPLARLLRAQVAAAGLVHTAPGALSKAIRIVS